MMRLTILTIFLAMAPLSAKADPKFFFNTFWPKREQVNPQDFRPYSQDPMLQQNRQWDSDGWQPQYWVNTGKNAQDVLDGFFRNGILVEQDVNCDNIPTLKVGEPFFHLSYREQNRIAAFIDYVYGLTNGDPNRAYYLTYRRRNNVIGVYTVAGLQMH